MIIRITAPYPESEGLDTSHLSLVSYLEAMEVVAVLDNNQGRIIRAYVVLPHCNEQDISISDYQEFARKSYQEQSHGK